MRGQPQLALCRAFREAQPGQLTGQPLKTQQKISGRLASDDVTQDRLDIRSYIDTARKHGRNAMDVLHDLMLGRPWRPPPQTFSPQPSQNPRFPSPHVNGLNAYVLDR